MGTDELNALAAGAPGGRWHRAGLTALVEALREKGFRTGPAEVVTAGRLLQRLAASPRAPARIEDLAAWLRPVFCSTREEQALFDTVFDEWARRIALRWEERPVTPPPGSGPLPSQPAPVRAPIGRWVAGATAAVIAALLAVWVWREVTAPDAAPPTTAQPADTGSPGPPEPTRPGPGPVAQTEAPALQGHFPALRESRSMRAEWLWLLVGLPAAALLLTGGVPGLSLMQGRRRSARQVVLDTRLLADEARQVLPALTPDVAGRLERHVRGDSAEGMPLARRRRLDARRTVEATLRNHGILSPRYRAAPLRPSYLMLIDAKDEHDPRGRLFYLWAERLRRQGLVVDIRMFRPGHDDRAAPVCWHIHHPQARGTGLPLDRLDDPPAGQRLVVISEARGWVEDDGRWRDWYTRARLRRWPQRAFFTPTELRDWGLHEERVEAQEHAADPGFLMLPLDESALSAWSELLATGSLPAFSLSEPQRYPRLLSTPDFDPFAEPAPAELDRLVAQLKLYLGDSGFRWLAALAVPPLVRWELTLLLGRELFERRRRDREIGEEWPDILARNYRRLARLPWMRSGGVDDAGRARPPRLPDWLRLRLLDELPEAVQQQVRDIVDELLSRLKPDVVGGLSLGFEAPPRWGAARTTAGDKSASDQIYLGYLSGLTPRQLALRMPGSWTEWLKREHAADARWWTWPARLVRALVEGLQALVGLAAFRDGMPWSPRGLAPAAWVVVAMGVLAMALVQVASGERSAALRDWVFESETREVLPPRDAGARLHALAPDGRSALMLTADGMVQVWDTATGQVQARWRPSPPAIGVRFSGDAKRVFVCDESGAFHTWDSGTGAALPAEAGFQGMGRTLVCQMGPGDSTRAVMSAERVLGVLGPSGPKYMRSLPAPYRISMSPNGRWVLVHPDGGPTASVWDARAPQIREVELRMPGLLLRRASWAGDRLGTIERGDGGEPALVLRNLATDEFFSLSLSPYEALGSQAQGQRTPLPTARPAPTALALSADARYAAIGDASGAVALWDVTTRSLLGSRRLHGRPVETVVMSDDGSVMWSIDDAGESRLSRGWQPPLGSWSATRAALSPVGEQVAVADAAGRIVVRAPGDAAPGVTLQGAPNGHLLALGPGGRLVAQAAGNDVRLGSARDTRARVEALGSPLLLLRFTSDGKQLVGVTEAGGIAVWPIAGGAFQSRENGSAGTAVVAAAMRHDGLLAVAPRGSDRVLVLQDKQVLQSLQTRGPVSALAFSQQGRSVWVASAWVEGWDVDSGAALKAFGPIGAAAKRELQVDDDNARIVVVSESGAMLLFDTASGNPIVSPLGDRTLARSARWLADGRLLVAERSGLARTWRFEDGRFLSDDRAPPLQAAGEPVTLEVSDDRRHLLALTEPRAVSDPSLDVATMQLKRLIDRREQLQRSPSQSKLAAEIGTLDAEIERRRRELQSLAGTRAVADRATLWALPDPQVAAPPGPALGRITGPHPAVVAAIALAALALLLVITERRHAARLARPARADATRVMEDPA